MPETKQRLVKIALIQRGPAPEDKDKTVESNLKLVDQVAGEKPDFICFNELSTTPYFCMIKDDKYFNWAEPIPGPITEAFGEKAKKYGCTILVPMFEKMGKDCYNSVAVMGPDGKLIHGTMPDGSQIHRYAKLHTPISEKTTPTGKMYMWEGYYFKPGPGIPVFQTPKATIGIVVCLDRYFPEAVRSVGLQGAEIAFIPNASPIMTPTKGAANEALFTATLQVRAMENQLWVAACNMGGYETVAGKTTQYYGRSCIVHPSGEVITQGPSTQPAVVSATVDLEAVTMQRQFITLWKYRRPEAYHPGISSKEIG